MFKELSSLKGEKAQCSFSILFLVCPKIEVLKDDYTCTLRKTILKTGPV